MSVPADLDVLAHELRAPVAALAALADAARGTSDSAIRTRIVALAVAAGRDVERILRDPGLGIHASEEVDVGALVESATTLAAQRVVGTATPGLVVRGDPTRLRQVLANLVANALRHGSEVRVSASAVGETVVVEVADDGPGVAPGSDPFARGESGAGSTGYGLWVARTIATAHGGTLELVPDERGARFRLVLPSSSAVP